MTWHDGTRRLYTPPPAYSQKNNEDEENETVELIDVPAQAVVKFVLELLMRHQQGATPSPATVDKPSPSNSSSPPSSPSVGETDASEAGDEEMTKDQDGQQADLESEGQEKVSAVQKGLVSLFICFERRGLLVCSFGVVSVRSHTLY